MTGHDELRKLLDETRQLLDVTGGEPMMIHTQDAHLICGLLHGFEQRVPSLLDELDLERGKRRAIEAQAFTLTRELEELRSAAREVVNHQNVDIAMHGPKMNRLRALVAPSVPETEETTDA